MGKADFEVVGVAFLTDSRKALRIELNDLPFTTFTHNAYVSVMNIKAVLEGKRKNATVVMLKPKEREYSCEAHTS